MQHARRTGGWLAVPVGIALGLALAVGIDRAAEPAAGQGGRSGIVLSAEQLRIDQRIGQQGVKRANRANSRLDKLRRHRAARAGGTRRVPARRWLASHETRQRPDDF